MGLSARAPAAAAALKPTGAFHAGEDAARDGRPLPGDGASPPLVFAGHLDRDGRLGPILDAAGHHDLQRPALHPSTPAVDGERVHRAARNEAVGG